ncbi:transmembrane protein 104 isoform X2 [Neopsephotus bourkii]|uniref:transmembrane protein 104 isoform X2 n=1 Tax=Neopsephotus bourkii TaxID=309878 RepID=UPI002AA5D012|nr:transmembrane protein 104 isoform X2 [Neopsephotus bourkii]
MAGSITDTGELYSPYVGLVYMFNLIVGTGALTMPKAFATAGWLVSLVLLMFLGFMSYMTTTFVVEAMAAANAQLRWKRMEKRKEDDEDEDSSSGVSDTDVLLQDGYERAETRPILSVQRRGSPNIFEITERVEMGQMASMFFNKEEETGRGMSLGLPTEKPALERGYSVCCGCQPLLFLHNHLPLWRPGNLRSSCTSLSHASDLCHWQPFLQCWRWHKVQRYRQVLGANSTDRCLQTVSGSPSFAVRMQQDWGTISMSPCISCKKLFLVAFTLLLGPFTFFNVQKTKYLQIMTSLMRWIAFILMIILALIRISRGQAEGHPSMAQLSGIRNLFGVCVYSFMCQHSLPSLITPISKKKHVNKLVLLDYILILAFYSLLSFTAIYCFRNDTLMDMYTLNFTNCEIINVAFIRYFLGLFPVFTISTNFPIIAVTLRNNWKTLFHREGGTYPWLVDRIVFPAITLIPPVLVAFCTHDLESLVGITGAYAGNGIQYLIPAFLAYCSRKDTQLVFGSGTVNKHLSPFRHTFWIVFVLIWGFSCFVFVTANIVLSESKL